MKNGLLLHKLLSEKSVYSVSKMIGEELIKVAANEGLDTCSMRLFNVYGPNMDPTIQGRGRVIPPISSMHCKTNSLFQLRVTESKLAHLCTSTIALVL